MERESINHFNVDSIYAKHFTVYILLSSRIKLAKITHEKWFKKVNFTVIFTLTVQVSELKHICSEASLQEMGSFYSKWLEGGFFQCMQTYWRTEMLLAWLCCWWSVNLLHLRWDLDNVLTKDHLQRLEWLVWIGPQNKWEQFIKQTQNHILCIRVII